MKLHYFVIGNVEGIRAYNISHGGFANEGYSKFLIREEAESILRELLNRIPSNIHERIKVLPFEEWKTIQRKNEERLNQ